jgi:fucose 4-O-acetylase-like acetyltransferase
MFMLVNSSGFFSMAINQRTYKKPTLMASGKGNILVLPWIFFCLGSTVCEVFHL